MRLRGLHVAFLTLLAISCVSTDASAQLISPGKLTEAHAALEGMRQCTTCHTTGRRGTSQELCLGCHVPLRQALADDRGFHSTLPEPECSSCHKEHGGRTADIVRFDPDGFQHESGAGFALEGAHAEITCSQCHNRRRISDPNTRRFKASGGALDRTYMGLNSTCVGCHVVDDPHLDQFRGRGCQQCHDQIEWTRASDFDHNTARFRLDGAHSATDCASCHTALSTPSGGTAVRFRPLPFGTCLSCHDDNHDGRMGSECSTCHATSNWTQIARSAFESQFDHASTSFLLAGAHRQLGCASCHSATTRTPGIALRFDASHRLATYPRPSTGSGCMSCHVDVHERDVAATASPSECTTCHTDSSWIPTTFDLFRHNSETDFELVGAHATVPCTSCHVGVAEDLVETTTLSPFEFVVEASECVSCHRSDNPHGGQFEGRACESCHSGTNTFRIEDFNHERTSFPLVGSHDGVACALCHTTATTPSGGAQAIYRPIEVTCRNCHADLNRKQLR